ncbi:MAG: hypothetical protein V1750_01315 [Acidobacteriota bacterium]
MPSTDNGAITCLAPFLFFSFSQKAIELHVEDLPERGEPVPPPASIVKYVDVAA